MTAKQKSQAPGRVPLLARDMLIACISIGQLPGDGETVRQFVRHAREFYSEVDKPTAPRKAAKSPEDDDETGHAEALGDFE